MITRHERPDAPALVPGPDGRGGGEGAKPRDGSVLTCSGLHKRFGERVAVNGVGFTIGTGETYGLLGPNGAGKTTTISMVCGILARDEGTVVVDGRPVDIGTTEVKGAIGYVPQDLAIYPDLTALENLRFFGRLYGMGGQDLARRVDEVLEVVDLRDRAKERTEQYSGGMKRRLNIAIGLLHTPRLLVLDEPTVGVDPQSRNAILAGVEALSAQGMGILYTTHYMEEAERLCDRVGIIDEGRIIAEGTRRELVNLVGGLDKVSLSVAGDARAAAAELGGIDGVREATAREGAIDVLVAGARSLLPRLLEAVTRDGVSVRSVEVVEPDLESVFLHLTGKALRD
ncbi:MAG TPA: ABC transporter ATP-binding protein [Candidatus Limnocylindrales bacterium]|nr:ABC transporter ATP-binding protein [Candidatus Limnocylindrales bacterium]